jgi:hypothetical protein
LVSDDRLPSIESIQKRVELQIELERKKDLCAKFYSVLGNFDPLSEKWAEAQKERAELPKENISTQDTLKISRWNEIFSNQLKIFDFQSVPYQSVSISSDSYSPIHEGYDLQTNISASDFIRIIWAYLNSLLVVSREFQTNHPGLLIFDEPRQQGTKDVSLTNLLKIASSSLDYNQQVIVATSENYDSIQKSVYKIPHELINYNSRIINKI